MKRTTLLAIALLAIAASPLAAAPQDEAAIAEIEKLGGTVRQIAAKVDLQEVAFHLSGKDLTDEGLVHLAAVPHVVWLNLKDTKITDAGLQHLAGLTELTRLHLERTGIGDSGLAHLSGLANLEYLNLYGTKVGDPGLAHLAGLKKLKKLYLWETQVTDDGVATLQKALPELEIVRGADLQAAKPAESQPDPAKPDNADQPPPTKSLAKGRIVKVRLEGSGRVLSLAEVQVRETGSGAELQKAGTATQSSVTSDGVPQRGIDGNTNQVFTNGSVTHTAAEDNPWWQVDLGDVKDIGRIRLLNRGDCCGDRLADGIVEVLGADNAIVWSAKVEGAKDGSVHVFEGK